MKYFKFILLEENLFHWFPFANEKLFVVAVAAADVEPIAVVGCRKFDLKWAKKSNCPICSS